jgi:hypothetical protein
MIDTAGTAEFPALSEVFGKPLAHCSERVIDVSLYGS